MSKLKMVLLDAGHGGMIDGVYQTAGKRSPEWDDCSQYFEGVGNRLIRDQLIKMLKCEGVRFKIVNEGDKDMALGERVNIVNAFSRKYGVNNTLLISIHSDAFTSSSANGYSCYTTKGETGSDKYAEALLEEMACEFSDRRMRRDTTDGDLDKEAQFYILRKTICPAILSENFFMTNESECKEILMSRQGRKKIAKSHLNMIKRFV